MPTKPSATGAKICWRVRDFCDAEGLVIALGSRHFPEGALITRTQSSISSDGHIVKHFTISRCRCLGRRVSRERILEAMQVSGYAEQEILGRVAPTKNTTYDWRAEPVGLYLHVPFCESKCIYC